MISEQELPVFTLGWELEATNRAVRAIPDVAVGHDGSVSGDGLEYRTKREAVFDPERSLAALRALVMTPGLRTDRSCGFHVHVGLGMKTRKLHAWAANYVTLARLIENEAFAAVPETRRENRYCHSWKDHIGSVMAPQYSAGKHNNATRYCWVNPVEIFRPGGIRTIEVRLMGHTHNYLYLLAWISFCRRMAASSWALVHDPSRLEQEVADLKEILKNIKACFVQRSLTGIAKAKQVVLLAARAGFYEAMSPTLRQLKEQEKTIRYEMDKEAHERDNYAAQILRIREHLQAEAQSICSLATPLEAGDIVEALVSGDYIQRGAAYTVVQDDPSNQRIRLARPDGGWWVARSNVKLVERRNAVCAV